MNNRPKKGFAIILVLVAILLAGATASVIMHSFQAELKRTRTARMEAQARQEMVAQLLERGE